MSTPCLAGGGSREFTHFFALMLWVAAALAFIAGMPQLGVAVLIVVVVNGVFSHVQEERAERAASRLQDLLPSQVIVLRDGQPNRVEAAELVRGDVVVLTAGDRIPADVQFIQADNCAVDESMLSGESEPVEKNPEDTGLGGTFLLNGAAEAVVAATGVRTTLADIASLTATVRPPQSPLNNELRRIVRIISTIALSLGGVFFAVSLLAGTSWRDAFLFAIGVSVALIPEGLLPTVTLSLAMGAQRMAGRNALVRHLQAVETLGSTTFICTDKTGTLTQNRMSAVEVWTPDGTVSLSGAGYAPSAEVAGTEAAVNLSRRLNRAARAASRGRIVLRGGQWLAEGDPMEAALDALAYRLAGPGGPPPAVAEIRWAFDPVRRHLPVDDEGHNGQERPGDPAQDSVEAVADFGVDQREAFGFGGQTAREGVRADADHPRRPLPANDAGARKRFRARSFVHRFGFTGEQRFINLKALALEYGSVRGHLVPGTEHEEVITDDILHEWS